MTAAAPAVQKVLGSKLLSGAVGDALPATFTLYFMTQAAIVPVACCIHAARYGVSAILIGRFISASAVFAFLLAQFVMFLSRDAVRGSRSDLRGLIAAVGGTYLLVLPLGEASPVSGAAALCGWAMIAVGSSLATAALLSLKRCWGLLPEARGLITAGPYRIVRNPIYAAEEIAVIGGFVLGPTWLYACAVLIQLAFQIWRAINEERILRATFPAEYEAFERRTPWRFIPGII